MEKSEITLNDVCTPAAFEEEHPELFAGREAASMGYLLRLRKINGLEDAGAVIEITPRRFLVVRPNFRQWLEFRRSCKYSSGHIGITGGVA